MKHGNRFTFIMLLAGCMMFLSNVGFAQYRGSLHGTVTDPQGAVVSGATVTLLDTATNHKLTATTGPDGLYTFNALPPDTYTLTVNASGFKQNVLDHINLIPDQPNALDVQMQVGNVQETVTVTDATPPIDTATANVSGTISSNQIQHMPSFGRDVFKLVELAPGVLGDNAQPAGGGAGYGLPGMQSGGSPSGGSNGIFKTENGAAVAAGGQQYQNNSYTIDGISTTSAVWGGSSVITPSEDSVQDVKVVSNSYDAEIGRFSGAQVQVISKSGTNNYHGSLFFTAHRPGLNAYQRFNGLGNKVTRDNTFFSQFGGSVGGPIWKNKVFAFFNYETVRTPRAAVNSFNQWAETAAFDKLAPANSIAAKYLSFPGNAIQSTGISPSTCATIGLTEGVNCATIAGQGLDIGSPIAGALGAQDTTWVSSANPGVGGGLDGVADIANYTVQTTSHNSAAQYNGRIDADVTSKDRIGGSIYWVPQSSSFTNGPARGYNIFHHSQINDAFTAIWNRTLTPSLLNEFRANAAGWRWNEITSNPQSPVGLPTDNIGGIGSITPSKFGPSIGSILNQWTYSIKDVATKVLGRHNIKFGGDVTRLLYLQDCAGCGVPNYSFFNLWDFLNDAPHQEGSGFNPKTGVPTTIRQDQREDIWGFFVQDDFKVTPNLTLNLGVRWSYFGPLSSKEGNLFVAVPGQGSAYLTGLTVQNKSTAWNAQKNNFGPQIGFAWSPSRFENKMVVRGGYGLNYNQIEIATAAGVSNNPGIVTFPSFNMDTPTSPNPGIVYAVSSDVHNIYGFPANPNVVSPFGANGLPITGGTGVIIFPSTLPTPRTHHWSLETQYELPENLVSTIRYLGSVTHNNYFHENPLAMPAILGYPLNPSINGGDYWGAKGYGSYNALQLELAHNFSRQFMADAQFTWSKTMDTSSGPYYEPYYPYDPGLDYALSDYNVGKAFKLYGMWQPTLFHGNSMLDKVVGGWTISGIFNLHSGFPWSPLVSVQGGNLYCGQCGYGTLYPQAYLGGSPLSTSNDAYKNGTNFPNGGAAYFSTPTYTAYSGTASGTSLPTVGLKRNSMVSPGYKDVDMTLAKAFGLPKMPVLGENAKFEFRLDAYNVFNNMNLKPAGTSNGGSISDNIAASNFGRATGALGGRVVTLGARFNF